jgi:hypothetical protein
MVLYKALGHTVINSLNGSKNTGGVAQGLTTALNHQNSPVNDMLGRGEQMVFTLKTAYVYSFMYAVVGVIIPLNAPIDSIH